MRPDMNRARRNVWQQGLPRNTHVTSLSVKWTVGNQKVSGDNESNPGKGFEDLDPKTEILQVRD